MPEVIERECDVWANLGLSLRGGEELISFLEEGSNYFFKMQTLGLGKAAELPARPCLYTFD